MYQHINMIYERGRGTGMARPHLGRVIRDQGPYSRTSYDISCAQGLVDMANSTNPKPVIYIVNCTRIYGWIVSGVLWFFRSASMLMQLPTN